MKKIFVLLLTILFSITLINASEFNINKKGSIDVTVKYDDNTPIKGAKIKITKIANVESVDGILKYTYVEELENSSISLKNLDAFNYNSKSTAKNIVKSNIKKIEDLASNIKGYEKTTDSTGHVKFNDLSLGLYLVSQVNKVKGYTKLDSYMLTVPYGDETSWTYDIESLPKPEIEKLIDVKVVKEWNPNSEEIPNSITIELLLDEEVIETVNITSETDWIYTFEDLQYSRNYSVREKEVKGYKTTYKDAIYENNMITLGIINTGKLPQTGSYTFIQPILFVVGMLLIGFGYYINKRYE